MEDKDIAYEHKEYMEDVIHMIVADTITKILTATPTDSPENTATAAEKMTYITVYDDDLNKAYEMSKDIREYD
jgi:hypothetical protein